MFFIYCSLKISFIIDELRSTSYFSLKWFLGVGVIIMFMVRFILCSCSLPYYHSFFQTRDAVLVNESCKGLQHLTMHLSVCKDRLRLRR